MVSTPKDLKYTASHEWVRLEKDLATVGITDHAQDALTDVVFVELPKKGATVVAGKGFGVVESVKSVSELYAPLSGTVVEANEALTKEPERVNTDPYGKGWMIKIKLSNPAETKKLMSSDAYEKSVGEGGH